MGEHVTAPFVVIGCGKAKRALAHGETCRAIDLYTGPLFAARLAHARALGGPHAILSAAYHLLEPDRCVGSYEADLRKRSKREREHWEDVVAGQTASRAAPGQRVIVLASGPYGAFAATLRHRFKRDVVVLGEDIAAAGGAFKCTEGLLDSFGPRRVIDTPITEHGFAGVAVGSALAGLRTFPGAVGTYLGRIASKRDGRVEKSTVQGINQWRVYPKGGKG